VPLLAITALDVAFVSAIGATVVGVAAPFLSWLTARHATASAQALAREERLYANRVDAYDAAMTLAYQMQAAAVQSVLAMDRGEETPLPPGYDPARSLDIAGRIEVRGSVEAARALVNVSHAIVAYLAKWEELGGPFAERPPDEVRQQLYELRDAVTAARQELGNRIRADLGHA
jgi:hypothetical protein